MTTESGRLDEGRGAPEVAWTVEPTVVTCEVDLTRDDLRAWAHYSRRHVRGRVFWSSVVSCGCVLGVGVVAAVEGALIASLLAYVVAVILVLMQDWMSPSRQCLGHCRYAADAAGLTAECQQVWTRRGWAAIERVGESCDHFFLINAAKAAIIIPKRGFPGPDDVAQFRELAPFQPAMGAASTGA